ncbi:2Fe-2S iron-sulfur cluster-binding protein [Mesorhizobium sp. NPDC059054]|uniref:2Fe-2S iron-sulfur cluster-binding protein n=1 Tax=Mesorhizobium sp. NPDC059054 TaxID=3346711 RepID=UPI0036B9336F
MNGTLYWRDRAIPFSSGQTVASALMLAGVTDFGAYSSHTRARYFCGIGACQSCLVSDQDGPPLEACITIACAGMRLRPFRETEDA